ncbi:hypothetical protein MMC29_002781 [Sticta canariensis]|nr:hypothetical protein [Sticta canariensis]
MPVTQHPLSSTYSSSHRTSSSPIPSSKRKKRKATVFDAVAGRVSSKGFLPSSPLTSINRDTASSTTIPNAPEEVLFRRRGAPERYEEDDFYWADHDLAPGIELPDSDLLKAVHAYAAGFYGRTGGVAAFGSLDETALIAVGVLLEEWGDAVLGKTGHEVFLEGERRKAHTSRADSKTGKGKCVKDNACVKDVAGETRERRRRKGRKIEHQADDGNGNDD